MAELVKNQKETTFGDSLGLSLMYKVKGRPGIYMPYKSLTKPGYMLMKLAFQESTSVKQLVKRDHLVALGGADGYKLPKLDKETNLLESYELSELLTNLHTWKKGKNLNLKGYGPAFFKNVCPDAARDIVYKSDLDKLVHYYNYLVSHINK